jgi:hypothetical protein
LLLLCCFIVVSENWGWLNPLKLFACLASFMLVFRCLGALLFSEARSAAAAYREVDQVAADVLFDLHRLAHNGKVAEAAKMLEAHLKAYRYQREGYYFNAAGERVEVGQGATVFTLAAFPRLPEHSVILWHLLRNFGTDCPHHTRLGEALLLAASLAYVDLHDRAGARECLARIQRVAPLCVESAAFIELARQIRSNPPRSSHD